MTGLQWYKQHIQSGEQENLTGDVETQPGHTGIQDVSIHEHIVAKGSAPMFVCDFGSSWSNLMKSKFLGEMTQCQGITFFWKCRIRAAEWQLCCWEDMKEAGRAMSGATGCALYQGPYLRSRFAYLLLKFSTDTSKCLGEGILLILKKLWHVSRLA